MSTLAMGFAASPPLHRADSRTFVSEPLVAQSHSSKVSSRNALSQVAVSDAKEEMSIQISCRRGMFRGGIIAAGKLRNFILCSDSSIRKVLYIYPKLR